MVPCTQSRRPPEPASVCPKVLCLLRLPRSWAWLLAVLSVPTKGMKYIWLCDQLRSWCFQMENPHQLYLCHVCKATQKCRTEECSSQRSSLFSLNSAVPNYFGHLPFLARILSCLLQSSRLSALVSGREWAQKHGRKLFFHLSKSFHTS